MKIEYTSKRPEPIENYLDKEMAVYDLLDRLHIDYRRVEHEAAYTMEICQEIEKVLKVPICKNLFLCNRQKTKFYLLMLPSDKIFKTKDLSSQINSARLSFANDEDLLKYLNLTPGSCSVLGLMYDQDLQVSLIIDQDLFQHQYLGVHPCVNTATLSISTQDLFEKLVINLNHKPMIVKL